MNTQERIYVTTHKAHPSFLVHPKASEKFISQMVHDRYGLRESGAEHEWVSEIEEVKVKEATG